MPELPEVETMVRGIRRHAVGRRIMRTEVCRCSRKPISLNPSRATLIRRTKGQKVVTATRLAKRVVLSLESGDAIVIEPRMTGLVLVSKPPTSEHRRICWHMQPQSTLSDQIQFWDRRGLGTVSILNPQEQENLKQRLGHDALELDQQILSNLLQKTRREIKVALLDQSLIAGIGNLYASEILHMARISPFRAADSLSGRQVARLLQATLTILHDAVRNEGSTLGDGTYRTALNQDGSYQNHHQVYQRVDEPCLQCAKGKVARVVQAQRATFYCPRCQR
jgi:formamidopyrimidine-DNA glycosylase